MLRLNNHRDGHISITVGTRADPIFSRWKPHCYRILKNGSRIIVDSLQQLAIVGQNSVIGILRTIRITAIEIGIDLDRKSVV